MFETLASIGWRFLFITAIESKIQLFHDFALVIIADYRAFPKKSPISKGKAFLGCHNRNTINTIT